MQTELTGRQVVVTKKLRAQAEAGLNRIERILARATSKAAAGKAAAAKKSGGNSAHVVLSAVKYRQTAEVTVKTKNVEIVGLCESTTMETALHDALVKVEKQALKHMSKLRELKRKPKEEKVTAESVSPRTRKAVHVESGEDENETPLRRAKKTAAGARNGAAARNGNAAAVASVPVLVHSFPAKALVQEPHILRSRDSVALRPMSLEEAVKEAEFRDRDVFVFRDKVGSVMVLHRKRDGKIELIEAPM